MGNDSEISSSSDRSAAYLSREEDPSLSFRTAGRKDCYCFKSVSQVFAPETNATAQAYQLDKVG